MSGGWEERLGAPELSEEAFEQIVMEALAERVGATDVRRAGRFEIACKVRGHDQRIFLDNIWARICAGEPEERASALERHLGSVGDDVAAEGTILPRPVDRVFIEQRRALVEKNPALVLRPLAADISIAYVVDRPRSIRYIDEDELAKLGLTPEELHVTAIANLRELEFRIETGDGIGMIVAGGDYECSFLFRDDLWERLAGEVEGDLVACIPTRDVLLYTGTGSEEHLATVERRAQSLYYEGANPISATLLRRVAGRWEPLFPAPAEGPCRGVMHPDMIDLLGRRERAFTLVIDQSAGPVGTPLERFALRKKLGSYASFALDGQMGESFPDAKGGTVTIEVLLPAAPDADLAALLDRAREGLARRGIGLGVRTA